MHVWVVHKRLIREGTEGRKVQEALFDLFWDDTSARLRAMDVPEISVSPSFYEFCKYLMWLQHNKYLLQVQGYSFQHCAAMDDALRSVESGSFDVIPQDEGVSERFRDLQLNFFW